MRKKIAGVHRSNIARFSTLGAALNYSNASDRQYRGVRVVLGDDNKFWVCWSHRQASRLNNAGYDYAN